MKSNAVISETTLSEFSAPFVKYTSIFQHFEKNMTIIAYVFPKLRTFRIVSELCWRVDIIKGPKHC